MSEFLLKQRKRHTEASEYIQFNNPNQRKVAWRNRKNLSTRQKFLAEVSPGWHTKKIVKTVNTLRLKDSHNRIFGTAAMKKYDYSYAALQRSRDLRGKKFDIITSSDNTLVIKNEGK